MRNLYKFLKNPYYYNNNNLIQFLNNNLHLGWSFVTINSWKAALNLFLNIREDDTIFTEGFVNNL